MTDTGLNVLFVILFISLGVGFTLFMCAICGVFDHMSADSSKYDDTNYHELFKHTEKQRAAYRQLTKKRNVCIEFIGKYEVEEDGKLYLINAGYTKTHLTPLIACGSKKEALLLSRSQGAVCIYTHMCTQSEE